ncbi:MAG: hypothetical protein ACTSR8_10615 [Promethearchaeota archaeon]
MKILNKIVMGSVLLALVLSNLNLHYASATIDDEIDVDGDSVQKRIQANERVQFRFRKRTQLTLESNVNLTADINCDAQNIGDKDVILEIEADNDLEIQMKCTEEQKELGLQKGNTYQVRNQNRYRYQEGFCMEIKCNDTCDATLKMEVTEENQKGQWAYYDETDEEWVTVETEVKNGYLVAETDHFSTWTVLIPEEDYSIVIIGVGIGAAVLVAIVVILRRRK